MNTAIDFKSLIPKFEAILERGLCSGVGDRDGQMCIEAAICAALELPHGDNPSCVASAVRSYKIALNDKRWTSPEARAKGLRDLGIAQIGSKGVVNDVEFLKRLADKTARVLIPTLFREVFPGNTELLAVADRCEKEGAPALGEAKRLADAAYAVAVAAAYAERTDKYLLISASLALEVLRELKSPGCEWI